MSAAAIHAAGVRKVYEGARALTALDGISLDVRPGEFVSILGPSGCGKSTFLRCVAGLETISDGELRVDDRPVAGPPDHVGMVFQRDALLVAHHRAQHPAADRVRRKTDRCVSRVDGAAAQADRALRVRRPLSARTLRRHAAARRHRQRRMLAVFPEARLR
ncbi:ATP-binding cassette domain-containing protein [Variovorax sp. LjRoot175]|uniref:ATP-binding cassette domain-containing protein n=1 Tax=Variovorax sp. LjRoot175 TaxID=3342276 RepID=UPI003ECC37F0